jgi:hypothetical protein
VGSTHLVVLAVGHDSPLAAHLVGTLHQRGFSVVANRAAGGSDDAWDFWYDAAAVVLACEVRDEVDPGSIPLSLERVVPVALTDGARPPLPTRIGRSSSSAGTSTTVWAWMSSFGG